MAKRSPPRPEKLTFPPAVTRAALLPMVALRPSPKSMRIELMTTRHAAMADQIRRHRMTVQANPPVQTVIPLRKGWRNWPLVTAMLRIRPVTRAVAKKAKATR